MGKPITHEFTQGKTILKFFIPYFLSIIKYF